MTEWRYYILDEQGRSARVVNGVVQYIGTPTWLPQTPDGWQDIAIMWERNMARYGPMRNFSLPLGFVMDGATILRDGLYKNNVDRKLYLLIQKRVLQLDPVYFRDYYNYYYRGELDFTTAVDKQGESRFEVNIMEGGLWKLMKAKEDTVYSIPLDEDAINVKMDGLNIQAAIKYLNIEDTNLTNVTAYSLLWPAIQFINFEGTVTNAAGASQQRVYEEKSSNYDDGGNVDNYFLEASDDVTITVNIGKITAELNNGLSGELYIKKSDGTRYQIFEVLNDNPASPLPFTKVQEFAEQSIVITLNQGERLYLISQAVAGILSCSISWSEFNISVDYFSKFRQTIIKAFSAWQLFRKIVEKITGNADDAASVLLPTLSYAFTSGDGVRSLDGATVKTSLKEFFEALNVYEMCGIGVENNKIILERRQHFFQYGNPIQCGSSKEMEISPATDLFFSRLKIGHKEQNIDDVNGKFDFNGQYNYGSPILGVSNDLTIISPYKAGPYEIEITRINLDGKNTTDNSNDNDVFAIDIKPINPSFTDNSVGFVSSNKTIGAVENSFVQYLLPGVTFITNNALNPGPFTVVAIIPFFGQSIIVVEEDVIDSSVSPVTMTITSGLPYELRRDIFVTAGVPDPASIFNVSLSPARLVRKHGAWLRGVLEGYPSSVLPFNSANRNSELVAGGIIEKEDIPVSTLAAPMLSPWYFDYGTQVPAPIVDELESDQNRSIAGNWEGVPYEGFPIDIGIAPNTREEQKFKLLAIPGTDITKFIN